MQAIMPTLLTLLLAASVQAEGAQPPFYGMQLHSLQGPPEVHRRVVDRCVQAGIGLVRDECHWHLIEATPGQIIIPEHVKENVRYTRQAGLELLLLLNYGNYHYDDAQSPYTDEGRAAFQRYVEVVATQFKGQIKYYEVWNEPNLDMFWRPRANVDDYAKLLEQTWQTLKRIDPDCVVLGASISAIDDPFIDGLLARGGHQWMDVFSLHPYLTPHSPENMSLVPALKTRVYDVVAAQGAAKPIWITEIGWPTDLVVGVDYATQADMLARTYLLCGSLPWLESLGWYWYGADHPQDYSDPERNYGLFYADDTPKPAWLALDQLTDHFPDGPRGTLLDLPEPLAGLSFADGRAVVWSATGQVDLSLALEPITIQALGAQGAPVDLFPRQRETRRPQEAMDVPRARELRPAPFQLAAPGGRVGLSLTGSPLLVSGEGVQQLIAALSQPQDEPPALPSWSVVAGGIEVVRLAAPVAPRRSGTPRWIPVRVPPGLEVHPGPDPGALTLIAAHDAAWGVHPVTLHLEHGENIVARYVIAVEVARPARLHAMPARVSKTPIPGSVAVEVTSLRDGPMEGLVVASDQHGPLEPAEGHHVALHARDATTTVLFRSPRTVQSTDVLEITAGLTPDDGTAAISEQDRVSYALARRADRAPVIDANLDDWPVEQLDPIVLGKPEQLVRDETHGAERDQPRAEVYVAWDDDWLYLAARVTDDIVSGHARDHTVYKNDGIEIYISAAPDEAREAYGEGDFQYGFFWRGEGGVVWNWTPRDTISPGARIAAATTGDGYILEGAIPWAELGIAPAPGLCLGFNLALNDDDTPHAESGFGAERQWMWALRAGAWRNPRLFAHLWLSE